jgi:hypothetical protein
MPEFHVELASGLMRFSRLKIGSNQCTLSSSVIGVKLTSMMQMNAKRRIRGFTLMWSVSIFGKHLRMLGTILASLRTPKRTSNARILTLGTMVLGLTFVPACSCDHNAPRPIKKRIKITDLH